MIDFQDYFLFVFAVIALVRLVFEFIHTNIARFLLKTHSIKCFLKRAFARVSWCFPAHTHSVSLQRKSKLNFLQLI